MSDSSWPPPPIQPIFADQAAKPEPERIEPKADFSKAANDNRAAKTSTPVPAPSPGGPSLNQGHPRTSVAEKTAGEKLPDTRTGKEAPRLSEFNRLGRHQANAPDNGPQP